MNKVLGVCRTQLGKPNHILIVAPKCEERKKGADKILKKIMALTLLNSMKTFAHTRSSTNSNRMNTKRSAPNTSKLKSWKTKIVLKVLKEKMTHHAQGNSSILAADFPSETTGARRQSLRWHVWIAERKQTTVNQESSNLYLKNKGKTKTHPNE